MDACLRGDRSLSVCIWETFNEHIRARVEGAVSPRLEGALQLELAAMEGDGFCDDLEHTGDLEERVAADFIEHLGGEEG